MVESSGVKLEVTNPGTRRSKLWYWKSEENKRKTRARADKFIAKRRAENKCSTCANDQIITRSHCDECLRKERERRKKLRTEKALIDQCVNCSKTAEDGRARCKKCLKRQRELAKWRRNGRRNSHD